MIINTFEQSEDILFCLCDITQILNKMKHRAMGFASKCSFDFIVGVIVRNDRNGVFRGTFLTLQILIGRGIVFF